MSSKSRGRGLRVPLRAGGRKRALARPCVLAPLRAYPCVLVDDGDTPCTLEARMRSEQTPHWTDCRDQRRRVEAHVDLLAAIDADALAGGTQERSRGFAAGAAAAAPRDAACGWCPAECSGSGALCTERLAAICLAPSTLCGF